MFRNEMAHRTPNASIAHIQCGLLVCVHHNVSLHIWISPMPIFAKTDGHLNLFVCSFRSSVCSCWCSQLIANILLQVTLSQCQNKIIFISTFQNDAVFFLSLRWKWIENRLSFWRQDHRSSSLNFLCRYIHIRFAHYYNRNNRHITPDEEHSSSAVHVLLVGNGNEWFSIGCSISLMDMALLCP